MRLVTPGAVHRMGGMQIDSEALYLMLGQLISEMPDFSGYGR